VRFRVPQISFSMKKTLSFRWRHNEEKDDQWEDGKTTSKTTSKENKTKQREVMTSSARALFLILSQTQTVGQHFETEVNC